MKKNNKIWICKLVILGVMLMSGSGCKNDIDIDKKPPPKIVNGLDVSDIDGNVYHTVIIGTQEWMVENLKTTKYNDGTSIPFVNYNEPWINLMTPAYCWYNDDTSTITPYGALYNWYTVNTGKLAPTGWHVPSAAEWTLLINYLGGESVASVKLKETGITHWKSPPIKKEATNETGFTALPGGYRNAWGCEEKGETCWFWSSQNNVYLRLEYYNNISVGSPWVDANSLGLSVRCIKD